MTTPLKPIEDQAAATLAAPPAQPRKTFTNPAGIATPRGYTHVVSVDGPHRTVYVSGQLGLNESGQLVGEPGDFRAQAEQAYRNVQRALDAHGASFADVIKTSIFMLDIRTHLPLLREVREAFIHSAQAPASTTVEVPRLAVDGALFEIEAIAVIPARNTNG